MRARWWVLMMLVGCGDDAYTGLLKPPPSSEGMQLSLTTRVEPGEELTVCKNFAMPEGTYDIGRFEHAMTNVSHHILVYPLDIAAAQVTDDLLFACDESPENQMHRTGILYGAQGPGGELALPEGIVFSTRGGLSLQLEYHIFNAGDEAVDATAAFNVWRAKGDVIGEAGMLFLFHNLIAIPPMSRATARQKRSYPTDFNLMMLVPHMHSRGVAMQASRVTANGSDPLFSVTGWENDTVYFDPPIAFQPGDALDYTCEFNNTSSDYVFDGFSARHDEMCVTGGIYYRYGDRMPLSDEFTFGSGVQFTGSNSCSQIAACDEAIDYGNRDQTPTPYQQFELCLVAGCQAGANAYTALDICRSNMCKDECGTFAPDGILIDFKFDDPACTSCVDASCSAQRDACPSATCP
ncbi:MAG TPA: hypothetical protein VIV11_13700 [Kofleriaceae bacterium]